jgi:hypothetical protein
MRKLSEYKDKEAIELLANILEPTVKIFGDKEVARELVGGNKLKTIQLAMKKHPDDVFELLATLEGVPVNEYHCSVATIPTILLDIMHDEELTGFFTEQAVTSSDSISGLVTVNTEEQENTSSNI